MYNGYVFPIGNKPNDASWTGFQNHNPETSTGYLTIFREINNKETMQSIQLKFLKGKTLQLENLLTGKIETIKVDTIGNAQFSMADAPSFLFLKYILK